MAASIAVACGGGSGGDADEAETPAQRATVETVADEPDDGRCSQGDAEDFQAVAMPLMDEWQDASDVASATGRIALAAPLATLQDIRRAAVAAEVPECAAKAAGLIAEAMDLTIDSLLAFMAQEPESEVSAMLLKAERKWKDARIAIDAAAPGVQ